MIKCESSSYFAAAAAVEYTVKEKLTSLTLTLNVITKKTRFQNESTKNNLWGVFFLHRKNGQN